MAAGDLVVADWQLELRTTLMGAGSNYLLDRTRSGEYTPYGVTSYKAHDVDLASGDGSYAGSDRAGPLTFVFPLRFAGTASAAGTAISTMRTTWAYSASDIPLYHRIPGVGKFHVNGRPRGCNVDASDFDRGLVRFTCLFVALDPTITIP